MPSGKRLRAARGYLQRDTGTGRASGATATGNHQVMTYWREDSATSRCSSIEPEEVWVLSAFRVCTPPKDTGCEVGTSHVRSSPAGSARGTQRRRTLRARGAGSRRVGRAMSCTRSTSAGMSAAISAPAPAAGEEGSRSEEKCLFVSEIVTKQ